MPVHPWSFPVMFGVVSGAVGTWKPTISGYGCDVFSLGLPDYTGVRSVPETFSDARCTRGRGLGPTSDETAHLWICVYIVFR